jgi:hypothetical protein
MQSYVVVAFCWSRRYFKPELRKSQTGGYDMCTPARENRDERRNLGCSISCSISSDMIKSVSGSMTKAM